jgi:hypothetical protein
MKNVEDDEADRVLDKQFTRSGRGRKALARALKKKIIAGAELDVFEKEPLPPDSPLLDPEIADCCRVFHHFSSGAKITRVDVEAFTP